MPTTTALASRPTRSLYSGMILALIALALALQASFLVGLAGGRGGLGPPPGAEPALTGKASASTSAVPCVNG